jgi:hypothetical protein
MNEGIRLFDISWTRFAVSGTLIGCFGIVDALARRRVPVAAKLASPRWVRPLMFVSIGGFYLLIGPTGAPLLGGWGNLLGIALACLAYTIRLAGPVRYPDLASRCLFYVALPIAVGVPWGFLVLSLPACAASLYCCVRAEKQLAAAAHPDRGSGFGRRYRMFYGIW